MPRAEAAPRRPEDQARQEFTGLLTVQAMNYLHSGGTVCFCEAPLPVKLRVLALVHDHLVPPEDTTGIDILEAEWKMEATSSRRCARWATRCGCWESTTTSAASGRSPGLFKPHIVFNLMEAFAGIPTFDQNVVSYLELLRLPYTGCNPRGLILARDKALSKKLLAYHRIPCPGSRRAARPKADAPQAARLSTHRQIAVLRGVGGNLTGIRGREREQLARRTAFIHDTLGTAAIAEQFIDGRRSTSA